MAKILTEISDAEQGWLESAARQAFGNFEADFLEALKPELEWIRLTAGDALFRQGERDDSLYFVIGGRLRVFVSDDAGVEQAVNDVRRGETLGELALFTGEVRSATVVAVRDSLLVRLARVAYERAIRVYPPVSLHVSRLIIERARRTSDPRASWARPGIVAILPLTPGASCVPLAASLKPELMAARNAVCLAERDVTEAVARSSDEVDHMLAISRWLDDQEAKYDLVLLTSEHLDSSWSRQLLRHADEVVWVADATADPQAVGLPNQEAPSGRSHARQTLLLCHPAATPVPRNTAAWLDRFRPDGHLHVRSGNDADISRLVRHLLGTTVGIVFGGGGARGFAHLGILKALEEAGIPVDRVGGCSIGSVMAALAAFDRPVSEIIAMARRAFAGNPTGDFNPLPLMSLLRGERLRATIETSIQAITGQDCDIEDTWKPLYCIASNYSRATEAVLVRGNLGRSIRASVSIPGALPPVIIDGELMIDGGTFNNFPTDVMARAGTGVIIGSDLMRDAARRIDLEEMPGSMAFAVDRLRSRRKRRYRLPGIASILMNVSIMHSQASLRASRALADICFTPDLARVGMLDWKVFDRAIDIGYRHAREVLAALPEDVRRKLPASTG